MSRRVIFFLLGAVLWGIPLLAQEGDPGTKSAKPRPPRVPDGPFVPKRDMIQRERGQFWAGPQDEGRFIQIMTFALVPREQLEKQLQAWPMYGKLSEEQRSRLMERIDEFWMKSSKEALGVAQEFQFDVRPENEQAFVRAYWMEKIATEKAIREELSPLRKRLEGEARSRLETKFKNGVKP